MNKVFFKSLFTGNNINLDYSSIMQHRYVSIQQKQSSSFILRNVKNDDITSMNEVERKELWKTISSLERKAVEILLETDPNSDNAVNEEDEVYRLLAESTMLKEKDPFISLAPAFEKAKASNDKELMNTIMAKMKSAKLPPHLSSMVENMTGKVATIVPSESNVEKSEEPIVVEEVDPGSTFSDTVTEKIRVKVGPLAFFFGLSTLSQLSGVLILRPR
jgi:hypothetical protein